MTPTPMIGLRVKPDDLKRIDAAARKAGLDRTKYMIRQALNPAAQANGVQERLDELEARVKRLEER
jgi:uncharacterized protein (DUF1778 family)